VAIVNMSVDTESRQASVTVDGVLVPAVECHLNKFIDFDGITQINLAYTLESRSENGLQQRTVFFLPDPDVDQVLNEHGLASKVVKDESEVVADISKFMSKEENQD